jgi:hypothetical protein
MSGRLMGQHALFLQRNTFLHAALGVLAVARRVEPLLEILVSSRDACPSSAPAEKEAAPNTTDDQLLVYAVLGAIGLAQRVQAVAAQADGALQPLVQPRTPVPVRERATAPLLRELAR